MLLRSIADVKAVAPWKSAATVHSKPVHVVILPEGSTVVWTVWDTPVFLSHICLSPMDSTSPDSVKSQPSQQNAWITFPLHRNECCVHSLGTVIHCEHVVTWWGMAEPLPFISHFLNCQKAALKPSFSMAIVNTNQAEQIVKWDNSQKRRKSIY